MERNTRKQTQFKLRDERTLAILKLHKQEHVSPFLDGTNLLYIHVLNQAEPQWETRRYYDGEASVVEHRISRWLLDSWIVHGTTERVAYWLKHAELVWEKQRYFTSLKHRLLRLPEQKRKREMYRTYARMLQSFLAAKEWMQERAVPDAYQAILQALHEWACLVAWKKGEYPQPAIWQQVKQLDPSVYKLYEELIDSSEPLDKRIELLLLPTEFGVVSLMKECTMYLTDIIQTRNRPWSVNELMQQPGLADSEIDLYSLLEKMAKRSIVLEIELKNEDGSNELGYRLSG